MNTYTLYDINMYSYSCMKGILIMINEEVLPHVIFRVANNLYAIDSKVTVTLTELPNDITPIQKKQGCELGIMKLRNEIVSIISMRNLFGCKSSNEEYEDFKGMIDNRKDDHIRWVHELKKSVNENRKFTLTTDPHQCAFGKWYDNFSTDIQSINFHMKKIDSPHTLLHEIAIEVEKGKKEEHEESRKKHLEELLDKAEKQYMSKVLELLDDTKNIFKDHYHDMVIVIMNKNKLIGLAVDEILTVDYFIENKTSETNFMINRPKYISAIGATKRIDDHVFLIDESQLFELYK